MKEINIKIDREGKLHFDFDGYKGDECFRHRDLILRAIKEKYGVDVDIELEEKKQEAYIEDSDVIAEGAGW